MLHHTNNAENKGTTLAVAVNLGTLAPFTMTLADGSPFANIDLPFYFVLAPQAETEASDVEVMEITDRPTADTVTVNERGVNGSTVQAWPVGSKVQVRMTGQNHEELVEEVEALTLSKVMGNIIASHNYG